MHALYQQGRQSGRRIGVAEYRVIGAPLKRLLYLGQDREVGVGDPHRQYIPATVPVPLDAAGIAEVYVLIEIVGSAHVLPAYRSLDHRLSLGPIQAN